MASALFRYRMHATAYFTTAVPFSVNLILFVSKHDEIHVRSCECSRNDSLSALFISHEKQCTEAAGLDVGTSELLSRTNSLFAGEQSTKKTQSVVSKGALHFRKKLGKFLSKIIDKSDYWILIADKQCTDRVDPSVARGDFRLC